MSVVGSSSGRIVVSAGTPGISLAFVYAALGYRLHIVSSDAFSVEKGLTMRAFGAVVDEIPSEAGQINERSSRQ